MGKWDRTNFSMTILFFFFLTEVLVLQQDKRNKQRRQHQNLHSGQLKPDGLADHPRNISFCLQMIIVCDSKFLPFSVSSSKGVCEWKRFLVGGCPLILNRADSIDTQRISFSWSRSHARGMCVPWGFEPKNDVSHLIHSLWGFHWRQMTQESISEQSHKTGKKNVLFCFVLLFFTSLHFLF